MLLPMLSAPQTAAAGAASAAAYCVGRMCHGSKDAAAAAIHARILPLLQVRCYRTVCFGPGAASLLHARQFSMRQCAAILFGLSLKSFFPRRIISNLFALVPVLQAL